MRALFPFVLFAILPLSVLAEDWATTDGKTYQNVKVIRVEDDAVTILDSDGGALVSLELLPADLQQRFHYNADKAKIAATKRTATDHADDTAIAQQKKENADQKAKLVEAMKFARANPTGSPAPSTWATSPPTNAAAGVPPPTASTPAETPPAPSSQFALNRGQAGSDDASHEHVNPAWKMVWSDEFDGSAIDSSKWNFEIDGKGNGNNEQEYYSDQKENAHLENGHLIITAIKDGVDANGKKHRFTSARMNTKGKFSWLYGRFEARIKMPTGRGVWPAFWMMPEDAVYGGWARSGEIDIVEEVGHQPATAYGTLHYGDKWPGNTHTGDKITLPNNLSDDFHLYAVEWEPGVMRWYVDGNLYQTQTKWYTKAAAFPAPFDQKFFLILNFAVGGAWPGPPAASTVFPQTMDVDYVRVYQPAAN